MSLKLMPCDFNTAREFVGSYHRHNKPPVGHKFSIACYDGDRICGVCMVGRPIGRYLDDGLTLEVNRCCTDGTKNACSFLYGACCRAATAMGYSKVITYTLLSENGASLKASNFKVDATNVGGVSWNVPSRPREEVQTSLFGDERKYPDEKKIRWIWEPRRKTDGN